MHHERFICRNQKLLDLVTIHLYMIFEEFAMFIARLVYSKSLPGMTWFDQRLLRAL